MALKKQSFSEDEIGIFDDAIIYKRGDYWHFRMRLVCEGRRRGAGALRSIGGVTVTLRSSPT